MSINRNSLDTLGGLWIGAIGLASLGLQPQIVLASIDTGLRGIAPARLATLEIGSMAVASAAIMCGLLGSFRVSLSSLGCALMAAGNLLAAISGDLIAATGRVLAGLGEGILASAGVVSVLDSARPVRISACFVTIAAIPPLAGSVILSLAGHGHSGVNLPLMLLAGGSLLALIPVIARRYSPPVRLPRPRAPTVLSFAVIALLCLLNAVASACWTYLGALGRENGLDPAFVGHSLSVGLAMQMTASVLLAWRGPDRRLDRFLMIAVCAEGGAVLAASEAAGLPMTYLVATAIFGFSLHAVSPLVTGLFTQTDPTRRSSYLILPVTLLGIAAGPAVASLYPSPAAAFVACGILLCGIGAAIPFFKIIAVRLPISRAKKTVIATS